jgi:hypothetical protein
MAAYSAWLAAIAGKFWPKMLVAISTWSCSRLAATGQWQAGSLVSLYADGELRDGSHRCRAVIRSNAASGGSQSLRAPSRSRRSRIPGDGKPTPRPWVVRVTKRRAITGAGQERLPCGGPKLWSLNVALNAGTEAPMSAERGWIAEPQPARQWHDSHYSREADRIAARYGAGRPGLGSGKLTAAKATSPRAAEPVVGPVASHS